LELLRESADLVPISDRKELGVALIVYLPMLLITKAGEKCRLLRPIEDVLPRQVRYSNL